MTKIIHNADLNKLLDEPENEKIYLFMQYFKPKNNYRFNELKQTMQYNSINTSIEQIYLLNEKIYKLKDLGLKGQHTATIAKVIQKNVKKRLSFKMLFDFVLREKINGYIVIANTDIFFDYTIKNLLKTGLSKQKAIYSLVRYEFNQKKLQKCKLFGCGRADSQDVWIIHSSQIPRQTKLFNFNFGVPGCDNKINYLFLILGYKIYNDPFLIKTYHNHKSQLRNYEGVVPGPHCYVVPTMPTKNHISQLCKYTHLLKDHKNIEEDVDYFSKMVYRDNEILIEYLKNKLESNTNFIIPRVAGVENNVVHVTYKLNQKVNNVLFDAMKGKLENLSDDDKNKLDHEIHFSGVKNFLRVMKNNAGILIGGSYPLAKYTVDYLKAFDNCDAYMGWGKWGNVYKYIVESHDFINSKYKRKNMFSALTMDIFNYIHNPWTRVLKGKRILIVSPFIESIKKKESIREKIYGVDLFPECTFVYAKPPQTQGQIRCKDYNLELEPFLEKLNSLKNSFDIALCSCGGYGNIVVNHIYEMGKSAIYVGGVLQMYFGIYGMRWMRERKDIMNLFMNQYWTRPMESEKPEGYENVEKSAYW